MRRSHHLRPSPQEQVPNVYGSHYDYECDGRSLWTADRRSTQPSRCMEMGLLDQVRTLATVQFLALQLLTST
jgi:hypothetical protein